MRRLLVWAVLAACGTKESAPAVGADDGEAKPASRYDHKLWENKLASDHDRAVTELEALGNPAAIPALVEAWRDQERPIRALQVIIDLARPLTPAQAKAKYLTDYERTGRKASWEAALPALETAVEMLDPENPRSIDSAVTAAGALGESGLPGARKQLVELATGLPIRVLIPARLAAIRALGKRRDSVDTLIEIVESPPPPANSESYNHHLAITGAAVTALGEVRMPSTAVPLILAMYRYPELFPQFRRALVAIGASVKVELKQVLLGSHERVNELFHTDLRGSGSQPVSAKDFYAAIVLGDFRDPETTGALLVALQRPMLPVYYVDDEPSPNTQGNAILDAFKKIGAPSAADPLYVLMHAGPDLQTRILAINAFAFVSRTETGVKDLAKIAADNAADDTLRQEAASAFARLSRDLDDITILDRLAKRYLDASAKKRAEAGKLAKPGTNTKLEKLERALEVEKLLLQALIRDTSSSAEKITRQTAKLKKLQDAVKVERTKQRDATMPLRQAESAATAYLGYARMFQTHIARIEIARRCGQGLDCFAKALDATPAELATHLRPHIPDLASWTADETAGLYEASVERALLELGKAGPVAEPFTAKLLEHVATDNQHIRESILLALPKIAKRPCPTCVTKLDAALATKSLGALELETQLVRDHLASP
jgi:hypothetical protein